MIAKFCDMTTPVDANEMVAKIAEQTEHTRNSRYDEADAHFAAGRDAAGRDILHELNRDVTEWLLEHCSAEVLFALGTCGGTLVTLGTYGN